MNVRNASHSRRRVCSRLFSRLCQHSVLALLAVSVCGTAVAQAKYPSRPVNLVVGFAAGGSTDKLARLLAHEMQDALGQQVVIDNKPGAAGNIAAQYVAQSAPDGYTLFMATLSSQAVNPWIYSKPGFDPARSFEPVALVARYPLVMALAPSTPQKSPADVIAYARANPGKVFFSSAGAGSPGHLSGELVKSMGNVSMTHVAYKGGGPAMLAAMSGEVTMTIETIPAMIPHVKSGKLKGLAVTSTERSSALPDLPTLAEAGLPGFDVTSWAGIVAPAKTPPAVLATLQAALAKSLESPKIRAAMAADGAQPSFLPGKQFGDFMATELKRWGEVVKTASVKVE
ncbi:tripartite tricarboxylate transporter substrate binding protein [Imbroritus primus]|uniref:Tripartite tricarboxylate transporter substrate binding protein n=1 Tax=Imbroritus primus TaxID=3058603 RepID=A0ACD3STQ6_9BURK|nr:tripartite tricarboxylate transporter substrate binding protein [Burkholderiaceae bacterium PBA]